MSKILNIEAKIEDIEYSPQLCRELNVYPETKLHSGEALSETGFIVKRNNESYAMSRWVSPKRTRSYPRANVYDTYKYKNRITVIPIVKDEGKDGDRDYLQFDTIYLMSLLQVYVIIGYYTSAEKNQDYENKITNQKFDYDYLSEKFSDLWDYQSDALHWNLKQIDEMSNISETTIDSYYDKIASETGVELHSKKHMVSKLEDITEEAEKFKENSRALAKEAQNRESVTDQPKERTVHEKATITIENYIGGKYFLTVDEVVVKGDTLFLIEKKHTSRTLPSMNDIKNGLVLMILFTNLPFATIGDKKYEVKPVLGLTGNKFSGFCSNNDGITDEIGSSVSNTYKKRLKDVFKEGNKNDFDVYAIQSGREEKEKAILDTIANT